MPYTNPPFYSIDYNRSLYSWQLMGDLLDSTNAEARVKMRNQYYLPMPAAFDLTKAVSPTAVTMNEGANNLTNKLSDQISNQYNPNYHQNSLYAAYKTRGRLPSITDYTYRALMSTINKRPMILNMPEELEFIRKDIFKLYDKSIRSVLRDGTIWIIIDINPTTKKPTIKTYEAQSVPKWNQDKYVILREDAPNSDSPFEEDVWKDKEYIHKIVYMKDGNYIVETKDNDTTTTKAPSYMGKELKEMPVQCIGSTSLDWGIDQMPLLGIGNIAIQIYQKNCDLSNSQFLSCSPMLVFSGVSKGDDESQGVGAGLAVYLPEAEAKAYYTKTDTSALTHVSSDIDSLFVEAGKLGWALMGINKKSAESAAALQARTSANDATIQSITLNSATAIVNQLKIIARWIGVPEEKIEKISIDTNLAINSAVLSSADIIALAGLWEKKALGWKTLFNNIKNSQMVPENSTWEDELDDITNGHVYEPLKKDEEEDGSNMKPREDDKNSSNFEKPIGDDASE